MIFLFMAIVGSVFVTRVVTIPLFRETIAAMKKRRLAKQQKAGN
jgi:hypothetical protein